MNEMALRYQNIKSEIMSTGRNVLFIAVSKGQSFEKIQALYHLGHRDFGENYPQELQEKALRAQAQGMMDLRFHLIGHLQTNKVKLVVPVVDSILSVDSIKLLLEIDKRAAGVGKKIPVGFQINIDEESTKSGFLMSELPDLVLALHDLQSIVPWGLMILPDPLLDPKVAFQRLLDLSDKYQIQLGSGRSMGMSDDYLLALSCGSTCIRVGTALFGERSRV